MQSNREARKPSGAAGRVMIESCVVTPAVRGRSADQKTGSAGSKPAGSENKHPNQKGDAMGKEI